MAKAKSIFKNQSFLSSQYAILFALVFGLVGGIGIITGFAAKAPTISSFAIATQSTGYVKFSASTSQNPAPTNLVVTNNCYNSMSALISTQTNGLSGWITDANVGSIGYAAFNVTSKNSCFAYVHKDGSTKELAAFSYIAP